MDRFMLKVIVNYPKKDEEKMIIRMHNAQQFPKASTVLKPEDIIRARSVVKDVYMAFALIAFLAVALEIVMRLFVTKHLPD